MEQSHIIDYITKTFAEKLMNVETGSKKYPVHTEEKPETEKNYIALQLISVEELGNHNRTEQILLKEKDKKGNEIEYYTMIPSYYSLKYLVIPNFESNSDTQVYLGTLLKYVKDNCYINIDEKMEWIENNNEPILIDIVPEMNFEKQINIFNALGKKYQLSVFFQLTVGINSGKKENIQRVMERKFDAFDRNFNKNK
jgi:hypothetical protein